MTQHEDFVGIRPEAFVWEANPRMPDIATAILIGDPAAAGPFIMRTRLPAGARILPHWHREARSFTVLAGDWSIGFGEIFDEAALSVFPAGSVYHVPAGAVHFQQAGVQGALIQVNAIGPSTVDFIVPGQPFGLRAV